MRLSTHFSLIFATLVLLPSISYSQINQLGSTIYAEGYEDINGESVDMSSDGNVIVMGAIQNDGTFENGGHVRVFEWSGSDWLQRGDDFEATSEFQGVGQVVSLSGNGNVVAITTMPEVNFDNYGEVNVYEWTGATWVQKGNTLYGETNTDEFGHDISINEDGNILTVSAILNDGANTDAGHVRVYTWDGSTWVQKGNDIDGIGAYEYFGISVSIDGVGDTLIVGGLGNMAVGFARIFAYNGSDWVQQGSQIDGLNAYENCGREVKISADGSTIAVGSTGDIIRVRMFTFDGANWSMQGSAILPAEPNDYTGTAFDLSADGSRIAIGARGSLGTGEVRMYSWNGTDWNLDTPNIEGEQNSEGFGYELAVSANGQRVVVGAPFNTEFQVHTGVVRVFEHILSIKKEALPSSYTIYPNPTAAIINIEGLGNEAELAKLVSIQGELVLEQLVYGSNNILDLSELPAGLYYLQISNIVMEIVHE